jgi:hypothetical protein
MAARVAFLTLRGLVFLREMPEFCPALRHRQKNRNALDRYAASLSACGAIGGACSALVRANHGVPPVWLAKQVSGIIRSFTALAAPAKTEWLTRDNRGPGA